MKKVCPQSNVSKFIVTRQYLRVRYWKWQCYKLINQQSIALCVQNNRTVRTGLYVRSDFFYLLQVKVECLLKQRFWIKLCVKLGKTATETITMIKTAYKEHTMPDRKVSEMLFWNDVKRLPMRIVPRGHAWPAWLKNLP